MTVADELCDRVAFIVDGGIQLVESPHDLKMAHGARTVVIEYGLDGRPGRREFPLDGLGADADELPSPRTASRFPGRRLGTLSVSVSGGPTHD